MILVNGNQFVSALQLQRANRMHYDNTPRSEIFVKERLMEEYWRIRRSIEKYIVRIQKGIPDEQLIN